MNKRHITGTCNYFDGLYDSLTVTINSFDNNQASRLSNNANHGNMSRTGDYVYEEQAFGVQIHMKKRLLEIPILETNKDI